MILTEINCANPDCNRQLTSGRRKWCSHKCTGSVWRNNHKEQQRQYHLKWYANLENMEKRRQQSAIYRAKYPEKVALAVKKSREKHKYPDGRNSPTRPTPYIFKMRVCLYCEKEFPPTNSRIKYCCDTHAYEAQKIQVGAFHARKMQQNREIQRRKKDYMGRAKPPKETVYSPIQLQHFTGDKFEREIKRLLLTK